MHTDELIDTRVYSKKQLWGNLSDMVLFHRLMSVTRHVAGAVDRAVRLDHLRSIYLLDAACGPGDISLAALDHLSRRGIATRVLALDIDNDVVEFAARRNAGHPDWTVKLGNIRSFDYDDRPDIVIFTNTLHHFATFNEKRDILQRLYDHSSGWLIVSDLVNSPLALLFARVGTLALTRNRMTRHDGPASVKNALTAPQYRQLVKSLNIPGASLTFRFPFQAMIIARH